MKLLCHTFVFKVFLGLQNDENYENPVGVLCFIVLYIRGSELCSFVSQNQVLVKYFDDILS